MAPKLQDIADARVNFQSQSGGGFGRDITIMLGSDDPELLEKTAHQLVQEMEGIKEIRAPRRPETLLAHLGRDPASHFGTVNTPVYHASTLLSDSVQAYPEKSEEHTSER